MLPRLTPQNNLHQGIANFLETLKTTQFQGEIRGDFASRLISSTDNSIYQILPQAVVFPKTSEDIQEIFKLAHQPSFNSITFSPRGGGTGTNGQSLSPGIIIDCSKYMNAILEVNLSEGWVRVQPGVILDQLNQFLQNQNVFFAPSLSPSNRATIGGMINTDAAGKGSRIYGRTSDHILELTWVLSDGNIGISSKINKDTLTQFKQQSKRIGNIYKQIDNIVSKRQDLIEETFPKMTRFMTGYNLAKVYDQAQNSFDINRILSGSEGTLAVITEAKLKLTQIPQVTQLLVLHYSCFNDALKDAEYLLQFNPSAIETIDDKILDLAKTDSIYLEVKEFIRDAKAINLVEFIGDTREETQARIKSILSQLPLAKISNPKAVDYYFTEDETEIDQLWKLRKKGVGLLANMSGNRQPIAFIEDTAVPPSHLASYTEELQQLLSKYNLNYAMFGHVDVGCLHVRPALDMKSPNDEKLIRELSDQVVNLVRKYGGVMWGEHGKGFRSEYTPLFFGEALYQDLRKIKAAFDPDNKLNPGKIVTPYGSSEQIFPLESPLRGQFDRQVSVHLRSQYQAAFRCNGNGACFNFNPDDLICPSAKETRDRIHSPKGRAMLLKEWLLLKSQANVNPSDLFLQELIDIPVKLWNTMGKWWGVQDYSHEVYEAMQGCLSCKACVSQCPIHVDIPAMKSQFLQEYHSRYFRSLRDYLVAHIETFAYWQVQFPNLVNTIMSWEVMQWLIKQTIGIVNPPEVSINTLKQGLKIRQVPEFNLEKLSTLTALEKSNSVILLQDAFTSFYEANLVLDTYDLLTKLGYSVYVAPFFVNGKLWHLKGFLGKFETIAQKNISYLKKLAAVDIPLVGIEPSIVLTYRDEYSTIADGKAIVEKVQLLQEFIMSHNKELPQLSSNKTYYLLGHCSEKSIVLNSQKQWQQIFKKMGITLTLVSTGCCGMAGIYGHEKEHYHYSQGIYQSSWERHLPIKPQKRPYFLVTGYSCRSQVKRFSGWLPQHPIQGLLANFQELK